MTNDRLDQLAVGWLVDCLIADGKDDKVSRFSDYVGGETPRDLTIMELLALNPASKIISEHLGGLK